MFLSVLTAWSGPVATAAGAAAGGLVEGQGTLGSGFLASRRICQWSSLPVPPFFQGLGRLILPDTHPLFPLADSFFHPCTSRLTLILPSPLLPCLFHTGLCQELVVRSAVFLSSRM